MKGDPLPKAGTATTGWQGHSPRPELVCNQWAIRKQFSGVQEGHRETVASGQAHGHAERIWCRCRQEAWNIWCPR